MSEDDDDKPTVVMDLNSLKKQKEAVQSELESMVDNLEFAVGLEEGEDTNAEARNEIPDAPSEEVSPAIDLEMESENFAEQFLADRKEQSSKPSGPQQKSPPSSPTPKAQAPQVPKAPAAQGLAMNVILFDLESTFFQKSIAQFPKGYNFQVAKSLDELNAQLEMKKTHVVVFNYDVHPKAVNSLVSQMKKKFQNVKTIVMSKAISPERMNQHKATPGGAHAYYQYPLEPKRLETELAKLKKAT